MPTGHYRFRRSLGNVSSNFRGARPDTYPLLSYVLQNRALDLSNVGSLTIKDISGNGNDATLYTGRYVALSTAEYVQFTDPTAFTETPASVSIYARSADASGVTNVPINWGGTAVGGTIVDNGLWQQVDIDLTGISEATRLDPSVIELGYDGSDDFIGDLAYAEIKDASDTVLDTIPLNQLDGTYTDGDPCFSTGGRIGAYKGTPIGGIEEGIDEDVAGISATLDDKMWFDGVNDYVNCGNDSSLDITGSFTIEAKVLCNGGGLIDIINKSDGEAAAFNAYRLLISTGGLLRLVLRDAADTSTNIYDSTAVVNDGIMHSIKVEGTASDIIFTVDGVVETSLARSNVGINTNTQPLYIGARQVPSNFLEGIIYDVKISDNGTLVASYDGNGNTDAAWTDQIGSNDGTVNGDPVTVGQKRQTIPQLAGMDFNKRMRFQSDYITASSHSAISLDNDFSLTLNILTPSDMSSVKAILCNSSNSSNAFMLLITNNKIQANFYNGASYIRSVARSASANTHYFVEVSQASSVLTISINGEEGSSDLSTSTRQTRAGSFSIGARLLTSTAGHYLGGALVSDVNIYSDAAYSTLVASYLGDGNTDAAWTDQVGSNDGTVNGSPSNFLIPESTTAGLDALGNALDFERPNNATINLNGGGYVELPAIGDIRSMGFAIYYDGSIYKSYVDYVGSPDFIDQGNGEIEALDSSTIYVNGVATSTLQLGWNIVGFTFDADVTGFNSATFDEASFGNLLVYESDKALTADEHLQNFNAFKSNYGL